MEWKRCSKCKNLKPVECFWRQGDGYRSQCKDCMREKLYTKEYKDKKKVYDKKRYLKNKTNKKKKFICMRCDKKEAKVKHGVMFWCFDCLFKYEEENNQKLSVEVLQ